jgi:hypothetical protein
VSSDNRPPSAGDRPQGTPAALEVDLTTLASTIRGRSALPLTDAEAEAAAAAAMLASSLEGPGSDEELLANTLRMLQLVLERLSPLPRLADGDAPRRNF